jgi:hypothetical protein
LRICVSIIARRLAAEASERIPVLPMIYYIRPREFSSTGIRLGGCLCYRNPTRSILCSARLQAGTLDSSTCSPEGERYTPRP